MIDPGDPHRRSVITLMALYSVALGLALGKAIETLIDAKAAIPIRTELIPAFVAFFATLLPFYHGAIRHLESVYIEKQGRDMRTGSLLADTLLLFIEACFLVAFANLLGRPYAAAWTLTILLGFDAVWGILAFLIFARTKHLVAQLRWVFINLVTVPLLVSLLWWIRPGAELSIILVMIIAIVRTTVDYSLGWSFYFPAPPSQRAP